MPSIRFDVCAFLARQVGERSDRKDFDWDLFGIKVDGFLEQMLGSTSELGQSCGRLFQQLKTDASGPEMVR